MAARALSLRGAKCLGRSSKQMRLFWAENAERKNKTPGSFDCPGVWLWMDQTGGLSLQLNQRLAGHLGRHGHAHERQHGRCDISKNAVMNGLCSRTHDDDRHGVK